MKRRQHQRVTEDLATIYAYELLRRHGLDDYEVAWHDGGEMAGRCTFRAEVITLNRAVLLDTAARNIDETIKHEIAHALVDPDDAHDRAWFDTLIRIGGTGVWVLNSGVVKSVELGPGSE